MTRGEVLSNAVTECLKELYSLSTPKVEWENFKKECEEYSKKYKEWEKLGKDKPKLRDYCNPKPYEFYYIPNKIYRNVCDNYIYSYKLDDQNELLETIETLKNYCKEPIVDKWIEGENGFPGHKGYDHPDNLEREIYRIAYDIIHPISGIGTHFNFKAISEQACDKFFEFLDMAGNFFNWNRDLNTFIINVGNISPCTNKEIVIENWKKYRNKDIEINDKEIEKEYYGEELD